MAAQGVGAVQLRQAIGSAEALINEAKRELCAKELRERRACYERLHRTMEGRDEALLAEAIEAARSAEVDAEDLGKAEAKLAELRSMSEEERAAKDLNELVQAQKKEAFLMVKRDDPAGLKELLEGVAATVRWQDWKDYMGRSLLRFSQELSALEVERCLADLLGVPTEEERKRQQQMKPLGASPGRLRAAAEALGAEKPVEPREDAASAAASASTADTGAGNTAEASPTSESSTPRRPAIAPAEEAELQKKAFRAVVQNEIVALSEVIGRLDVECWSKWENKAGKDLLTLSQERGSSAAYSVLAKALGMVQELKRDTFEERETVWIFKQGEVQPLRATVLEDTPEDADDILIEYWDGDDPPCRVERCLVRKMWS